MKIIPLFSNSKYSIVQLQFERNECGNARASVNIREMIPRMIFLSIKEAFYRYSFFRVVA